MWYLNCRPRVIITQLSHNKNFLNSRTLSPKFEKSLTSGCRYFHKLNVIRLLSHDLLKRQIYREFCNFLRLETCSNMALSPTDPNSFSRPDLAVITHMHLDVKIDFSKKILDGNVILDVEKKGETNFLILDVHGIVVLSITSVVDGSRLDFCIENGVYFGSKLSVQLPETFINEDNKIKYKIKIDYRTSQDSQALQWLDSEQTAGKKHPYLFSQCQAILSRCMVPCQDTPNVKMTYSAEIKAPSELTVLMSALKGDVKDLDSTTKVHKFSQPVPIPSYLIAIAVGALVSKTIGPRSKVWSEKEFIDACAYEFDETETMLNTAEKLFGPYVWGVYDLLVLPPCFSYGGMENPCLTFVTPTLLAGDRSLANVIVHEICHSWTGNLVTNNNFENFWLNEGHTVFLERKVIGKMFSREMEHFEALQGLQELKHEILAWGENNPLTNLVPDLTGIDPDDAFSKVPYEKGYTLLFYLQQLLGGPEIFNTFLRSYIDNFKYKSLSTQDWKDYLYKYFSDKTELLNSVDWNAWFKKPGMPPIIPNYDTSMIAACETLVKKWINSSDSSCFDRDDVKNWDPKQKMVFLGELVLNDKQLSIHQLELMDKLYGFNGLKNSDIRLNWLLLCIKCRWESKIPDALEFATTFGRLKYVRPIFRALYDWEEVRQQAIDKYLSKKGEMMSVTRNMLAKDLHQID